MKGKLYPRVSCFQQRPLSNILSRGWLPRVIDVSCFQQAYLLANTLLPAPSLW